MYLRSDQETRLGQSAPQVFSCTVDAIALDDFQVGDYRLRPSHYEKLMAIREFARVMKNAGRPISVSLEGFTDSSGKEIMNKGLSVSRAAEVQNFLVRVGVDVHNVVGSGESSPRAPNATEAGRRKNRRVELRVCVLLPPPPPGGSYNLKVSNLMRQVGYQPAALLAGAPSGWGLEEAPSRAPWRDRVGLRPAPQYLSFLTLDQFDWNKASLTPRLREMVRLLAEHVKLSWKSLRPIAYIRLTGHTDNTGKHDYNVDLGNRRARTVKEALESLLKEDILKRRIAILIDESPGELKRAADNRTPKGMALNRRVEALVAPPEPAPPAPPPSISEETKKRIEEEGRGVVRPPYRPKSPYFPPTPPPRPGRSIGKSVRDKAREYLRSMKVPERIHDSILNLAEKGLWAAVDQTLQAADVGSGARQAIVGAMQAFFKITF
jgi:outer membrane protein OmpA-like peptidoglycan-associated protein